MESGLRRGANVSSKPPRFDQAFLERQRHRLIELRTQLLEVKRGEKSEETGINADVNEHAHESEDDAQRLTTLELDDELAAVEDERLTDIERALQKIDDGTYGLSEMSGAPIPMQRLEVYPEALYTLEEQNSREAT
jgi:DnaK suppressor protein